MRAAELVAEVQDYCRQNADPANAGKWARYFKEGYDAWGLLDKNHPLWTEKVGEWQQRYRPIGLKGILAAGEPLFRSGKYEEGSVAIHLVKHYASEIDEKALPSLAKWFEAGIANWAHTDVLCSLVLGPTLISGHAKPKALAGWRKSALKYQRRAVPVSLIELLKNGSDPGPLVEFVRPMMLDAERVVHQGLGWFLREAWKKDPAKVEVFLFEWKDTAPRLIFQYATEKMPPADRKAFQKAGSRR